MHRALLVSEILLEIFIHVNKILDPHALILSYREMSLARKSFAALARTCKPFHEPAMDLLWAELDGMGPMLGCVMRLHPIIYRSGSSAYFRRFEGVKPLSEHEACQFLRHAGRVRSLQILYNDHFPVLSVLPIATCMFPRLLSLSTDQDLNRYLHLFLSPTLRHCSLPVIHPDLKSVATRCAALEDLSIKSSLKSREADRQVLYDSIRLCKRLVTLACPLLNWTAWEHLSNLPTLLTLEIWDDSAGSLDWHNINFALFLNVTRLSFHTRTSTYIVAVMPHLEFPSLNQFEMEVHYLPWAEAEPLFHALSRCKTLSHIDIYSKRKVQDLLGGSFTPIRQSLCFTQLRTLRFNFPCSCINLDNDLLLEAMSSWPHIRTLEFKDPQALQATVTLRGLFAALRRCPRLHTLDMPVDLVDIDIDPAAESFQDTSLQNLILTSSDITDAEAVARIIFLVLPSVDRVIPPTNHGYERSYDVCLEVQKHLESYRASAVLGQHITGAALQT
ncbi:hypothetical protein DEU56DRAFT_556074 [Suillus clintonianus]|uniref:uncharacterized protein n=1 Tax=Suillus clintonianus TaxID=1904413 RepID=UPI001B86AF3C|nr:uncharacterized protein DEU56DRAFT_556074 [Suillus clintonianus]KAG2126213.1 hypothetical protein DEU56DRAFT_556074 [Suillus clintonianus]